MRVAREFRYVVPSRSNIEARLEKLVAGELPRAEAADWATEFITFDDPQIYPSVSDPIVWEAIVKLSGADLEVSPGEYLHQEGDFSDWLQKVRAG